MKLEEFKKKHDKGTMARNHGTGFRTYENKLPYLFKSITDL